MTDFEVPLDDLRRDGCVLTGSVANNLGRAFAIIVVLDENGSVQAYRNECEHVAVPLSLFADSMVFDASLVCSTHGARFRLDDGYCFEGPCVGQSLRRIPLVIDGDVVRVRWDDVDEGQTEP